MSEDSFKKMQQDSLKKYSFERDIYNKLEFANETRRLFCQAKALEL